jgi:hypothetical protein
MIGPKGSHYSSITANSFSTTESWGQKQNQKPIAFPFQRPRKSKKKSLPFRNVAVALCLKKVSFLLHVMKNHKQSHADFR